MPKTNNYIVWFRPYFSLLLFLLLLQPIGLLSLVFDFRSIFIRSYAFSFLLIDLLFILFNLKRISLNKYEILLLFFLISSIPIGLLNNIDFSRRHITDFLIPVIFLIKIPLIRASLKIFNHRVFFLNIFIKKYIWWNLYIAVIVLIGFYTIRRFIPIYIGHVPEIYPLLIIGILNNSLFSIISALAVVFFSGKRSILIGAIFVLVLSSVRSKLAFFKFLFLSFIIVILSILILPRISNNGAFLKYLNTIESFNTIDSQIAIDKISGGRFTEIYSVIEDLKWYDYILGKGVGYVYVLKSEIGWVDDNHANLHFSPLSIISKYGLLFYIILMFYVFKLLKSTKSLNKKAKQFFFYFIVGINIDFLFAYGFFINNLFPLALGYLSYDRLSVFTFDKTILK